MCGAGVACVCGYIVYKNTNTLARPLALIVGAVVDLDMLRYISLLLFIGLVWGQDKIVTVNLKSGEVIRGKILHGKDLNDYYVRLLTEDKIIKDIYTIDIVIFFVITSFYTLKYYCQLHLN